MIWFTPFKCLEFFLKKLIIVYSKDAEIDSKDHYCKKKI